MPRSTRSRTARLTLPQVPPDTTSDTMNLLRAELAAKRTELDAERKRFTDLVASLCLPSTAAYFAPTTQPVITPFAAPLQPTASSAANSATTVHPPNVWGHMGGPSQHSTGEGSQMNIDRMASFIARTTSARDLPTFGGNPIEWPTFKSQYYGSTHVCGLTEAENLIRLQRCLVGEARMAVASMLEIEGGAARIMQVLQEEFGEPTMLLQKNIQKAQSYPPLPADASSKDITDFNILVQNIVAALSMVGPEHLKSADLLHVLVNKLPLAIRTLWYWTRPDTEDMTTINDLASFTRKLGNNSRRAGGIGAGMFMGAPALAHRSRQEGPIRALAGQMRRAPYTVPTRLDRARHVLTTRAIASSPKAACPQCDRAHELTECRDFINLPENERWLLVRNKTLCFVCLAPGHRSVRCGEPPCQFEGCKGRHHQLLHKPTDRGTTEEHVLATNFLKQWKGVQLKIVPVTLHGPQGSVNILALLDEGSTVTLIDEQTANAIGAVGPVQTMRLHGAKGMCTTEEVSRRVELRITGNDSNFTIFSNTVMDLHLPIQEKRQPGQVQSERPLLLIGQDNAHLIVSREVTERTDRTILSRTLLGWTIHGGSQEPETETSLAISACLVNKDTHLEDLVKQGYAVDALGITATIRQTPEQKRAMRILRETTHRLHDGTWETGLLWRPDATPLPNNYNCALKRYASLARKCQRDAPLAKAYQSKIQEYIEKGYAHRASAAEISSPGWFLPHFAVQNPNKPGKIRIVFDAASRCRGTSLNDQLMTGPDMLTSLLGNILRFREGRVGVAADIREMFLRIKIRQDDQRVQRFLWDPSLSSKPEVYIMSSVLFGAKCSPCSAQYVRNQAAERHATTFPSAAHAIRTKFYMDDYLDATESPEQAAQLIRDISMILKESGFHLTSWASNNRDVLREVPPEDCAPSTIDIVGGAGNFETVLGVKWDPVADRLNFKFSSTTPLTDMGKYTTPTKRQMLSEVMKYFDPAGLATCMTIRPKILLQAVWRSGVEWDKPVKPEHADKWHQWLQLVHGMECSIPRCCRTSIKEEAVLHLFSDASEQACCAVAYLTQREGTTVHVSFIASKGRVAPLRPLSIPRLELQAALMAARLAQTIRNEMSRRIQQTIFWTDSTTVLCWLKTDPREYSTFVANRLGEIDEITDVRQWRWVPTNLNPADAGTRDHTVPDLTPSGLWFDGPSFLKKSEAEWPKARSNMTKPDDILLERKRTEECHLTTTTEDALPSLSRFSRWIRLIRATAWVLRFVSRCRREECDTELTARELEKAEILWTKKAQQDAFRADIVQLKTRGTVRSGSRLNSLSPILECNGLLRTCTRLAELRAGNLLIVDGSHPYVKLWIRHMHETGNHPSTERTVADIRATHHVLKLRTTVRMVVHVCHTCRFRKSHPQPPRMADLPAGRLAHHRTPFTHCGLDYFGPLMVTVGRRQEKRYGALFTCLTTRAVHLEMAASLSTDSAIMVIRRMSARRGTPKKIYSDNGTNFRGADREISASIRELNCHPKFQSEMANRRIEWHFIPPMSPHMGGAWERLVRSVKVALAATLKERSPREETLLTALAEAEWTINSRPLTHVSLDARDAEPLTPNHFLIGASGKRPHLAFYEKADQEVCLRKQWHISQQLADIFWRRWLKEYVPSMAQRQKWREPAEPIKIGDIVVIADGTAPRNTWPKGRIIGATPSADGQVRIVQVKTNSGTFTRPATKIIVLPCERSVTSKKN